MSSSLFLIGGLLSAFGSIQEGQIARDIGKLSKDIAEAEAQVVGAQKKVLKAQRDVERDLQRRKVNDFAFMQNAIFAKAGVELSGSPLDTIEETFELGELDIILSDIDAKLAELELEQRQRQIIFEGEQAEIRGRFLKARGFTRAGSTLLTTGAKFGLGQNLLRTGGAGLPIDTSGKGLLTTTIQP